MNLTNLRPEDRFIINACALNEKEANGALSFLSDDFDWGYYWDEVNRNGVGGFLYKNFIKYQQIGQLVPKHILDKHQAYYYKTLARNIRVFKELENVLQFFDRKGFDELVFLKGSYLLPEVYNDMGIRPMSDIDILVPDWNSIDYIATSLIDELGFHQKVYKRKWQEEYRKKSKSKPPELYKGNLVIELHTPKYFNSVFTNNPFTLKKFQEFKMGSFQLNTLENEQHLELLLDHCNKHATKSSFDLRMIVDIFAFKKFIGIPENISLLEYVKGVSGKMGIDMYVRISRVIRETKQLILHGYFFRYILATIFPSRKYLELNFSQKNNNYFILYFIYLFEFLRRVKK